MNSVCYIAQRRLKRAVSRRSIFAGNNVMLLSDVIDFSMLAARRLNFGEKKFYCWISCDLEVASESARFWGKIPAI